MRIAPATLFVVAALLWSAPAAWSQRPERIEVVNELDRDVLVWVNGDPRVYVTAGSTGSTADLPEGPVTLLATCPLTDELLATQRTALADGELFTWTLYPVPVAGEEQGTGIVVLLNGLDTVVEVDLGGALVATLAPGASRVLPRVVAGSANATARDPAGAVVAETTITIPDGDITRWVIGR
jgi:hypothetical protein